MNVASRAGLMALILAGAAEAAGPGPHAGGGARLQPSLDEAATRFAERWEAGDLDGIVSTLADEGILLDLQGREHESLDVRKARAALGDFFERHESAEAGVRRVSEVGGEPPRGFAEIGWEALPAGTSERLLHKIYVGFVQKEGSWKVSEIRVLS